LAPSLSAAQVNDATGGQKKLAAPEEESDLQRALKQVQKEPEKDKGPSTGEEFANAFFLKCVAENKPNYTTEIQEYMCACSSAKMVDYLSIDEMKALDKETRLGENARTKFIIHAHTACMKDAIKEIALNSCKESTYLKQNVVTGKMKICNCMAEGMQNFIEAGHTNLIMNAVMKNPMTIDPLHDFLSSNDFLRTESQYVSNCYNAHARKF
jgi:hypothetical protein